MITTTILTETTTVAHKNVIKLVSAINATTNSVCEMSLLK